MCGIAGVLGRRDDRTVRAMLATIRHRGPDDEHAVSGAGFTLGARRLSIIDLAGGRQPLANEDGTVWAVQNGEVYNFASLRERLVAAGHTFRTRSDTEVLVHLYEARGEAMVDDLAGMYAFCVWDAGRGHGLLVRDRVGKKPLYYWRDPGGALWFASELKELLVVPAFTRRIEPAAVHHYLSYKHVPCPLSIFQGVRQLPPGHLLRLVAEDGGGIAVSSRRYWRLDFGDPSVAGATEDELVDELAARLDRAVRRRLVADVPVGFFLSGGIDSGLTTALAARASSGRIETFTLTYDEESTTPAKERDRACARLVAQRYGTRHHEERIGAVRLEEELPIIVRHFDEPFSGVLSSYYLARRIRQHVKVALAGDGADEVFGSYRSHRLARPIHAFVRARTLGLPIDAAEAAALDLERLADPEEWRWRARLCVFSEEEKRDLYTPEALAAVGAASSVDDIRGWFDDLTARDPLNRVLEAEFRTQLPDQVLCYVDRLSMAHSLEVRAPFLDHEFLAIAAPIPDEFKIRRDGETKAILKKLALRFLPEEVVMRPKEGFLMPVNPWLRQHLRPWVEDVLSPARLRRHGWFRGDRVAELIGRFYAGEEALGAKLLSLLAFQLWHESYVVC